MKSIEILDAPALCSSSSPDSSHLCATTDSRQDNCALHKALTQHSVAKVPPQFGGKITNLQALNQTDQTHLYSSSYVLTVYLMSICISGSPPSSCGRSTTKEGHPRPLAPTAPPPPALRRASGVCAHQCQKLQPRPGERPKKAPDISGSTAHLHRQVRRQ